MQAAVAHIHEFHIGKIGPEFGKDRDSTRPLQGDQGAIQ